MKDKPQSPNQDSDIEAPKTKKSFKAKWEETDTLCPICRQVTKRSLGLTKQNMKRLLIGKPTAYDWIFFFIIVMTIFMAYQYNIETGQARYITSHLSTVCMQYHESSSSQVLPSYSNLSYLLNITSNSTNGFTK